jgi:hypothetical protein
VREDASHAAELARHQEQLELDKIRASGAKLSSVQFLQVKEMLRASYRELVDAESGPKALTAQVSQTAKLLPTDAGVVGDTDTGRRPRPRGRRRWSNWRSTELLPRRS